eukprot:c25371_g1_i3 orf=160-3567(+)
MELEVSAVPGMHNCFAALPMQLIYALQNRDKSEVFSVTLELRLSNGDSSQGPWYLTWAGAGSTSSSIEISKALADCIGLPCGSQFHVKALRNVSQARTVELEPATENDWEILGLNASFAEDHILSQVGVLSSGQQLPIWVEGDNALTLRVLSTEPKRVVRLVPGTEFIIAPKPRKIASTMESSSVMAWLRVQELHSSLMQPLENMSCSIAPTTAIFVSEEAAKAYSLNNGQLVAIKSIQGTSKQKKDSEKEKARNADDRMTVNASKATTVVVYLVYCDLVAQGHAMLASSLGYLIGAPIHSWIELKGYTKGSTMSNSFAIISPIKFRGDASGNSEEEAGDVSHKNMVSEWEKHKIVLKMVLHQTSGQQMQEGFEKKNPSLDPRSNEGEKIFNIWLAAQIKAISKHVPEQCSVLPIMLETVMQFSVEQEQAPCNVVLLGQNGTKEISLKERGEHQVRRDAETLLFLISLHKSEDPNERTANSETESATNALASHDNLLLLDIKSLEAKDIDNKESLASAAPRMIKVGRPRYITTSLKSGTEDRKDPSLGSMTWLKGPASEALRRLQFALSPKDQAECCRLGIPSLGYVLLHGPPACGKTKLALAIARELEENPLILSHKVIVKCAKLVGEQAQAIRAAIEEAVFEALQHAPSLIILDDLDMAIPSNLNSENSEPSTSSVVLSEYLSDLLDTFRLNRRHRCGRGVSFLALARAVSSLPASLCSSGRFDLHVALSAPTTKDRAAILSQELDNRRLVCKEDIISEIASKCDGYDTSDLEVLVDRAVHSAAPRLLCLYRGQKHDSQRQIFELVKEDFMQALVGFLPVSMRDIARVGSQVGPLTWEDVGGIKDTCRALQEMLELPVKYSKIFSKAPLRLRTGVLLYGPPGCGKTHVVATAAAACSLRLISVKGPEILNKYIGASEQGVRDMFAKASAAAPCILFFDEFDAIAPKRGHDNTGVTDRVVNQLLTELDGVEALNGVFVFAATSRPDLLDAALLRPGRLDRRLLCDFPTASERLEILQVLSRKLPLAEDTRLDEVASLTENFSGADLQAVLSDAQLEAVHRFLSDDTTRNGATADNLMSPLITMEVLRSALLKARPSVSEQERRKLYSIYDSFVTSRSSMMSKARDTKGKRATLA